MNTERLNEITALKEELALKLLEIEEKLKLILESNKKYSEKSIVETTDKKVEIFNIILEMHNNNNIEVNKIQDLFSEYTTFFSENKTNKKVETLSKQIKKHRDNKRKIESEIKNLDNERKILLFDSMINNKEIMETLPEKLKEEIKKE